MYLLENKKLRRLENQNIKDANKGQPADFALVAYPIFATPPHCQSYCGSGDIGGVWWLRRLNLTFPSSHLLTFHISSLQIPNLY
jgi:hypothetical protein